MNEQELREKIAQKLVSPLDYDGLSEPLKKSALRDAEEWIAFFKEAGYVQIKKGDLYFSKEQRVSPDPTKGLYND